jgi:hypothetical protein
LFAEIAALWQNAKSTSFHRIRSRTMHRSSRAWRTVVVFSLLAAIMAPSRASFAAEVTKKLVSPAAAVSTSANKPVLPTPQVRPKRHPLAAVLKFARAEQGYLDRNVHSFSCRLSKRERIEEDLQDMQYLEMQFQEERRSGDGVRPMRVYLAFLSPSEVKGRKVLFIEGQNGGKMLVRKGGKRFNYAVVKIDPLGEGAQRESMVPITDLGFGRLLGRQIEILESHARIDASGENTSVQHYTDAKINGRPCELLRITHARKQPGLQFHMANVYIDNQLHVPTRIDISGWPAAEGDSPPLIAEYTYTDLKLNVDFPESTFDPARLNK